MSLSLDDVRNKRFRMARKSGYEVLEVDEFVDEVEETFGQLFEENQNLKKQVEALKAAPAPQQQQGEKAPAPAAATPQAPAPSQAPAQGGNDRSGSPQGERIVVTTSKEASTAVVRLVEMSTEQSERLVAEATAEAERIRGAASQQAEKVVGDARSHAERLQGDALKRAESLDRETDSRRQEMFGQLEQQRDQLSATVQALRGFESTYRSNLTRHLQSQIEVLRSGHEEPADAPAGLNARPAPRTDGRADGDGQSGPSRSGASAAPTEDETPTRGGGSGSDTPRLDALLGDQR